MVTRVLLIEDDKDVIDSVVLIFERLWPDAEVIFSQYGLPGVEMVKTEKPEAVILDLGLPDVSGFEVLKKIRLFSDLPIIVLTAHTAEDDVVQALDQEATDYIKKPFQNRELVARVQSHTIRWKTEEIRSLIKRKTSG